MRLGKGPVHDWIPIVQSNVSSLFLPCAKHEAAFANQSLEKTTCFGVKICLSLLLRSLANSLLECRIVFSKMRSMRRRNRYGVTAHACLIPFLCCCFSDRAPAKLNLVSKVCLCLSADFVLVLPASCYAAACIACVLCVRLPLFVVRACFFSAIFSKLIEFGLLAKLFRTRACDFQCAKVELNYIFIHLPKSSGWRLF